MSLLERLTEMVQHLIIHCSDNSAIKPVDNYEISNLIELLATFGVNQVHEIGERCKYDSELHDRSGSKTSQSTQVIVACPAFTIQDPDDHRVTLRKAIVESTQ